MFLLILTAPLEQHFEMEVLRISAALNEFHRLINNNTGSSH